MAATISICSAVQRSANGCARGLRRIEGPAGTARCANCETAVPRADPSPAGAVVGSIRRSAAAVRSAGGGRRLEDRHRALRRRCRPCVLASRLDGIRCGRRYSGGRLTPKRRPRRVGSHRCERRRRCRQQWRLDQFGNDQCRKDRRLRRGRLDLGGRAGRLCSERTGDWRLPWRVQDRAELTRLIEYS